VRASPFCFNSTQALKELLSTQEMKKRIILFGFDDFRRIAALLDAMRKLTVVRLCALATVILLSLAALSETCALTLKTVRTRSTWTSHRLTTW
jgi:hypothetical protein